MDCYLLIDFGSTNTKLSVVDVKNEEILLTSKAITTIEDDIMIGFNKAYDLIKDQVKRLNINFIEKIACSSAAGGLKMIAIGLVPELTSEAAKRASLGAGAKILKTYSYELIDDDVEEMLKLKPEIILLSGGTDGGNKDSIIKNAQTLVKFDIKIPIIIACNKNAQPEVVKIFSKANFEFYQSENVMPQLNVLNVDSVREIIRSVFMKNIVHAKGLDKAVEYVGDILMPTPAAVLQGAQLLSIGTDLEEGLGDLIVIDIGGATTDVHSICEGYPSKGGINMKGLAEPFAKRSVEGDLGMRYSALSAYEAGGYRLFKKHFQKEINKEEVENAINFRHENIDFIPKDNFDVRFDDTIARVCCDLAMKRHAGYIEVSYSPFGAMFAQFGKDLTQVKYLIGTGGVLVNNIKPVEILKACNFDEEQSDSLRPMNPKYLLDKTYILSAMGLLSMREPDLALRILKKYLVEIKEEQ